MTLRVEVTPPPDRIPDGIVAFHPFTARREGDAVILGNMLSRKFLEITSEGLRAIELMQGGEPWERVGAKLETETGRSFDVAPFLRKLSQFGFVRSVGSMPVWDGKMPEPPKPPHPAWQLLRNKPFLAAALAPAFLGVALLLRSHRDDVLSPRALLFTPDPLLALIAFVTVSWLLVLMHEGAHYGMARALGIRASIRLSVRMQSLVAETDVSQAWTLPKPQRAAILLAGVMLNAVLLGYAELALRLLHTGSTVTFALRMIILVNVVQIIFQSLVFLRTDGYYLLSALGPERNLRARSFRALRSTLSMGKHCAHCGGWERTPGACALCSQGRPASARRRQALTAFASFTIAMSAAFLAYGLYLLWTGTLPFLAYLWSLVQDSRATGAWRAGAEALVVIALILGQLALIVSFWLRRLVRWQRARRPDRETATDANDA